MERITFKGGEIGKGCSVFVIAEAGVNHNGSVETAKQLIDAAKESGADAVKFQSFKAEDLVTEDAATAEYQKKNTSQQSQLELLKGLELSGDAFRELKDYSEKRGIIFLSSPHTIESLDYLSELVPLFKVGSGDLMNFLLLKKLARLGKPIILSTGMASIDEVREAIDFLKKEGCENLVVLHCTSNYPCPLKDVNLNAMLSIGKLGCIYGYSDHTEGMLVPLMASVLGAAVIEKHLTLDKSMPGPDHRASLNPREFKEMVSAIRDCELALGDGNKVPGEAEKRISKLVRKSIVAKRDIKSGEVLSEDAITVKRPAGGIEPKDYEGVIGKTAKRDIKINELISLKDLE